jgi:hypothetical protein
MRDAADRLGEQYDALKADVTALDSDAAIELGLAVARAVSDRYEVDGS